jgi:hypothetical protein
VIILVRILVALFLVVILIPHIYRTKILKIVRHRLDGITDNLTLESQREHFRFPPLDLSSYFFSLSYG